MINNPGLSPRIYQVLSDEKLCLTDNPIYMQLLTTLAMHSPKRRQFKIK